MVVLKTILQYNILLQLQIRDLKYISNTILAVVSKPVGIKMLNTKTVCTVYGFDLVYSMTHFAI